MSRESIFNRLSVRLTAAFLLAAILGVALVALLAYRSTSSDFSNFVNSMVASGCMSSGGMMGNIVVQAQGEFLDNLGRTLWIAGILGLVLAIVLGGLFTRQIVAPLGKVAAAARRMSQGDLRQRVDIGGTSELAELGESFNTMAEALGHDQELRHNMVADIAHELRTPLAIVRGNVEAMLDGVLATDAENLTSLHQETMLLTRLVEDLRTLSLAEEGQLKFQPEATDLAALARQVVDGFQTQFTAKSISVALESPERLLLAWADPDRTAQVMRNLLNNALNYTPEGGGITIKLTSDRESVIVSVVDTGAGIPPEDLPHIFDRFYRVDRSRTRSTGGSGLGLAIVKQLVEAQGGRVWVDSVMGKGSTFSFGLPLTH